MSTLLLVAGGTGGHLWPAIAFKRWIDANTEWTTCLVTGSRPLEYAILAEAGIDPVRLDIEGSPLGVSGIRSLRRWKAVLQSLVQARRILRSLRPHRVLLFGGYLSVPFLIHLCFAGSRTVLHEQNARAGKATRLARRLGMSIASGWPRCEPLPVGTYRYVGVPVRRPERLRKQIAWHTLVPEAPCPDGPIVVVMGGSLGSASLEERLSRLSRRRSLRGWRFLLVGAKGRREAPSEQIYHLPLQWDINPLLSVADIAVVRGGASTLSEMAAWNMPAVVVPWLAATDSHQDANARAFLACGKGALWYESMSDDELEERLLFLYREHAGLEQLCDEGRADFFEESVNLALCNYLLGSESMKGDGPLGR
ncbi:MAG: UDP-N-acetylglucosamine--N-acetylmuramyl-(pentapeptide) pyrophosphoryl-undecaprenol N-acetylglucosamine transferase [Synergistales bacterium]|nr:UDP-N-acetylglucosamine--N-acetylmuramyl-(pentapeptide) pyrophosphoryl-undecaprenol N-acetylglucosamine transferase [Synergistales bacterium]